MSNNLEEIDRHIEVLSSRWPKPYRQLEDAMVTRSLLVASQIAHHRETTAAYGMAIRKQERIEEAERECAALKARLAHIADIAHAGGLAGLTTEDAMTFIRRLTIQHWNKSGYKDEIRDRVLNAVRAADSASVNHRGQNGGDLSGMADSA